MSENVSLFYVKGRPLLPVSTEIKLEIFGKGI